MTSGFKDVEIPSSPLSRWDSRWKLAAILVVAFAFASLNQLAPTVVALALGLLLLVLSRLPRRWVRGRLGLIAFAALPFLIVLPFTLDPAGPGWDVGPVRLSERGLVVGTGVFCRCLAIGSLALVLRGTAPLPKTLAAAHKLRMPGLLVLIAGMAHRYAFLMAEELRQLRVALRTRGFRMRANRHGYRTLGHVTGALLVRSADRADRVAAAMRCRGFDGTFHTLTTFRSSIVDVVAFVAITSAGVALVVWDRLVLS